MKKENEIWKVIPNYENYEASNFGRIRSISGYCNNLHKDPNGYIWKYETKK